MTDGLFSLNFLFLYVDYSTGNLSDHFPIIADFNSYDQIQQGPGFWKLNSSLLKLQRVCLDIENIWKEANQFLNYINDIQIWWENLNKLITIYFKEKGIEHAQHLLLKFNTFTDKL